MSESLNIAVLHLHAEMRENGVCRIRFIRPEQGFTSQDVHMVTMFRAPFSKHHVIIAVFLVYVWTFRITSAESRSQVMNIAYTPTSMNVNLADVDFTRLDSRVSSAAAFHKK